MNKNNKLRYCQITCESPAFNRGHIDVAKAGLEAGADMIQLRCKNLSDEEMVNLARKILHLCRDKDASLIINDRIEVALKSEADGVHLGQEDQTVSEARKILGPGAIVGKSVTCLEEAIMADKEEVDYLGAGPVFTTPSKDDASEPIGLEELKQICRAVSKPVIAIGGINIENLDLVLMSGVSGIAVISAVANAENMLEEARRLAIGLLL